MLTDRTGNRRARRLLAGALALPVALGTLAVAPAMAAGVTLPDPIVTYDFENALTNGSGLGNDAIARDGYAPTYAAGVNGQGLRVVEGGNYVTLPSDVKAGTSGMTATFWYKQEDFGSDGPIFSNQDWHTGDNLGVTIANRRDGDSGLYWRYNGTDEQNVFDVASSEYSGLPRWNHITLVIDSENETSTIYRNGEVARSIETGPRTLFSGNPFRLGSDGPGTIMGPYPGTWITGVYDDFAFYDQPLSADQVSAAFQSVLPEGAGVRGMPAASAAYGFENALTDGSGHGNDGEPRAGNAPTYAEGVNGQGLRVVEGTNYVSLPMNVQPSASGMAASFWYKQDDYASDGPIFSNQNWDAGTNLGMTLANQGDAGGTQAYWRYNGTREENIFDLASGAFTEIPGWNHITISIDSTQQTKSLYLNGELLRSVETGERTLTSTFPFRLGSDGSGTILNRFNTWVTGTFDDFVFYDQPLTAQQANTGFRAVLPAGIEPPAASGVIILPTSNGSGTVDLPNAAPGDVVTLNPAPADGYHLGEWLPVSPSNLKIIGNTFTMPETGFVQIQPRFDPNLVVPNVPEGTSNQKVLVVGVDGLAWEQMHTFNMPNFDKIQSAGMAAESYFYAPPFSQTSSGPGYTTMMTGVWPDKHGVTDNSFNGRNLGEYPNWLERLENLDPSLSTLTTASWLPLLDVGVLSDAIDVRIPVNPGNPYPGYPAADEAATVVIEDILANQNPDATYVYYGSPDAEGHSFGRDTLKYEIASERSDERIGRLMNAIESRPTYAEEDWLIMVSTDHGFIGHGHGGPTLDERRVFVYAMGGNVPQLGESERELELVDIAATVVDHYGFEISTDLDGIPVGTPSADPFDTLKPELQGAVQATGPGAAYLGWTHTAPEGWAVDNSAMGLGGVMEFAGWSFVNDVFWSGTNQSQGRENFVRGRDVWAVADPAAWAKIGYTGSFDSTLTSEPFDVTGRDSATVSFMTQYRSAAGQEASVSVSFDGGEPVEIAAMTTDILADLISADVVIPEDATEMTVSWHLAAPSGGWYWAVDNPQVELSEARPVITVTDSESTDGVFTSISFALSDDVGLDRFELNGVVTDLAGAMEYALNGVAVGQFGAVEGANVLEVYDLAGNVATFEFTLAAATTTPPVTDPPVTDPPVTDPPVTDPPVTDPPADSTGDSDLATTGGSELTTLLVAGVGALALGAAFMLLVQLRRRSA